MARALGIDDSVTSCECCGKVNLKSTVVIELDSGEIVHYGSVCAARNTGKSSKQINGEIRSEAQRIVNEAAKEYRASPEYLAYQAVLARRPRGLVGKAAMEFVQVEGDADDAARARVAAKYRIAPYAIY